MERGSGVNNKRGLPDLQDNEEPKRSCHSFSTGAVGFISVEAQSAIESEVISSKEVALLADYIRSVVPEMVKMEVTSQIRSRTMQLNNQIGEEAFAGSEKLKFRLCFSDQIASTIFTNNGIATKNGKPLEVAICDATNSNSNIQTGPLSSARIEFVVLKGEFSSDQERQEEIHWSASDFNKNILSERQGRRPLIIGNDLKLYLNDGVRVIKSLSFTDNSSWTKSKKFRLGARITDKKILTKFPRIGEAVSEPFKVMDQRGQSNKKHHPPTREDEVWRLEGISKNGVYDNRLASVGIKTVDDFLKACDEKGHLQVKKLLGKKISDKTWKAMADNASECEHVPTSNPSNFEQNLVRNEAMEGEAVGENYLEQLQDCGFMFEDNYPPFLPHGEASTSYI